MMALHPDDRYRTPQEVMHALLPFFAPNPTSCSPTRDPLASGSKVKEHSWEEPPVPLRGTARRILIIDDEAGMRMFCREVLRLDGLECEDAGSGEIGLKKAMADAPDLILLDVNLPRHERERRFFASCGPARRRPI